LYDYPIADFIAEGTVIAIGAILYAPTLPPRKRPWVDISVMFGVLLLLQLGLDIARMVMKTTLKC
jgi:hypothetical protein